MLYTEWLKHVEKRCITRKNKVYSVIFQITSSGIYVERISISPAYRGRGYLKRIFTNLCKEFRKPIYFECTQDLRPMYEHIGCYSLDNHYKFDIEMYFDPFEFDS